MKQPPRRKNWVVHLLVLTVLVGAGVQAFFQNPLILSFFALVFVALAMSMFGFFNLQLPASLQAKLSETSNRMKGGTLIGVAVMGVLSALIVGPCAGPVLIGALIFSNFVNRAGLPGGLLEIVTGAELSPLTVSRNHAWMCSVEPATAFSCARSSACQETWPMYS